jgi:LysM repeat protein
VEYFHILLRTTFYVDGSPHGQCVIVIILMILAGPLQVGNLAVAMDIRVLNPKTMVLVALLGAAAGLVMFLLIDVFGAIADNQGPIEISDMFEQVSSKQGDQETVPTLTPVVVGAQEILPTEALATETHAVFPLPTEPTAPEQDTLLHTVQTGENIFRISLRYGVSIEDIMIANGLTDSGIISNGQILIIPPSEPLSAPTAPIADAPVAGTQTPQITPTPSLTPTPTNTPTPLPPADVNGMAIDTFIVLPPEVIANSREIFARGQELGINPRAFSKVGDSTIENPFFLARFDEVDGEYDLAEYSHLQTVIDHFAGSHEREGMAVKRGFHSWTVTDPMWADKSLCLPNETPVACEIRIHRPAFLFLRLGSNDAGVPGSFDFNMRQVVEYAIDQGVIPIIGTKADRFEGGENINNEILRRIASDYQLPLWDFDLIAETIPNRGLYLNDVHLTVFYAHDYSQQRALQTGHGVHNLTALMMLDALLKNVVGPAVGFEE